MRGCEHALDLCCIGPFDGRNTQQLWNPPFYDRELTRMGRFASFVAVRLLGLFLAAALLVHQVYTQMVHRGGGAASTAGADIYASKFVVEAPRPSLSGSSHFADARGTYERRCFLAGAREVCVNILFTRKGFYRSGDLHQDRQVNHIVAGALKLTQRIGGIDVASIHRGPETVVLPAHTPHLYEFLEDTLMTEHWIDSRGQPAHFRAWLYLPYRSLISNTSLLRALPGSELPGTNATR